jgi:hypothetical protein
LHTLLHLASLHPSLIARLTFTSQLRLPGFLVTEHDGLPQVHQHNLDLESDLEQSSGRFAPDHQPKSSKFFIAVTQSMS